MWLSEMIYTKINIFKSSIKTEIKPLATVIEKKQFAVAKRLNLLTFNLNG